VRVVELAKSHARFSIAKWWESGLLSAAWSRWRTSNPRAHCLSPDVYGDNLPPITFGHLISLVLIFAAVLALTLVICGLEYFVRYWLKDTLETMKQAVVTSLGSGWRRRGSSVGSQGRSIEDDTDTDDLLEHLQLSSAEGSRTSSQGVVLSDIEVHSLDDDESASSFSIRETVVDEEMVVESSGNGRTATSPRPLSLVVGVEVHAEDDTSSSSIREAVSDEELAVESPEKSDDESETEIASPNAIFLPRSIFDDDE